MTTNVVVNPPPQALAVDPTPLNESPERTPRGRAPWLSAQGNNDNAGTPILAIKTSLTNLDPTNRDLSPQTRRSLRRPSPGLLARMRLLDDKSKVIHSPVLGQDKIGRIPESQLREIDNMYRTQAMPIERRGRAWSGTPAQSLSQAGGGTAYGDGLQEPQIPEGDDHSSIISTSERLVPSDSDDNEEPEPIEEQNVKYRLPELEKTISSGNELAPLPLPSERPPTPPPKDPPPMHGMDGSLAEVNAQPPGEDIYDSRSSMTSSFGIPRPTSIYSLSRISFTSQLSQLTSLQLPQASSLSGTISDIPTATEAARALTNAAAQIKRWIGKAADVLNGLNAEDDVEWSAEGGREGLGEVDQAINTFESLINVYVTAIEELQSRSDIATLPQKDLEGFVAQMEEVLKGWHHIRQTLKGVKGQVEIAMEWEELWNSVLGEIGMEMDALGRLTFEMEERRHRAAMDQMNESANGLDINELETIMEEAPISASRMSASNRFSLPPAFPQSSPLQSPATPVPQEDSNLLALFARMQPLRASLDFLPMRLSHFNYRGRAIFPTACEELEHRREVLETQWRKLEADAEALRRELGEDRWILVFRNAGRQATKMCESVNRSLEKLREAIESGAHQTNLPATAKKIESFEAKKMHYGPAIERVLAIIDRGVKDRLTVNGEILRLQAEIRRKWSQLEADMKEMDFVLEELNMNKSQQLRDSISTILSTDRSVTSSAFDTPGSSPASSVVMMGRKSSEYEPATPLGNGKGKHTAGSASVYGVGRRHSSLPTPSTSASSVQKKSALSRLNSGESSGRAGSPSFSRLPSTTPIRHQPPSLGSPYETPTTAKPRWNSSTIVQDTDFKPLSTTTPSPYSRSALPRSTSRNASYSNIPVRSPLSRDSTMSPPPPSAIQRPSASRVPSTPQTAPPSRIRSPIPHSHQSTGSSIAARRSSRQYEPTNTSLNLTPSEPSTPVPVTPGPEVQESPTLRKTATRPASALASGGGRRSSMLPQPKRAISGSIGTVAGLGGSGGNGRESRTGVNGRESRNGVNGRESRSGMGGAGRQSRNGYGRRADGDDMVLPQDQKPRWKF